MARTPCRSHWGPVPGAVRLVPALILAALAWFLGGPSAAGRAGLDPYLAQLAEQSGDGEPLADSPLYVVDARLLTEGRVRVQLDTGPSGLPARALRAACGEQVPSLEWEGDWGRLGQATLDLDQLDALCGVAGLHYVMRPVRGVPLEAIVSDGVAEIGADAYHQAGYRGAGLTVGVLDVGFDGAQQRLGTELPADTKMRAFAGSTSGEGDLRGQPATSHGTACAEIVHDALPGAVLCLANATTLIEMEAAIRWLREEGAAVISHSVGWFWGPGDGTGVLADIVHDAVDRHIVWVNASGNQAQRYWGGPFQDADGDGLHEFTVDGDEDLSARGVPADTDFRFVLTWDLWPYSHDAAFEVEIHLNEELLASSAWASNPEIYAYREVFTRTPSAGRIDVRIRRTRGAGSYRLRLFRLDETGGDMPEHRTTSGSIVLPADSPRVLSVGAYRRQGDRASLESFSSRGPNQAGAPKPELCALDSVRTSVQPTFRGTSAACPLAAAAVALLQDTAPPGGFFDFRWEMAELFELLRWSAVAADLGDPDACAWGLLALPGVRPQEEGSELLQAPATPRGPIKLWFRRPLPGPACIELFDIAGRRVGGPRLLDHPGPAPLDWSVRGAHGHSLPGGVYLLRAQGPGWSSARRLWRLP